MVNRSVELFISGFRYDAHPMAMMCGVVGAMSSFYHDSLDITNEEHRKISAHRLIAKDSDHCGHVSQTLYRPALYLPR